MGLIIIVDSIKEEDDFVDNDQPFSINREKIS
jgi:hypothetical protein